MLLGIVLHAALSFTSIPWVVQDTQQSEVYHVLFAFLHGFRMPLFFMLSGFFTAMLWRKRGLGALIVHRIKRILLPLVLGCFTIIPAMWAVSYVASRPSETTSENNRLFTAVVEGDVESVRVELQHDGVNVNAADTRSGSTPLCTAVFVGHTEIVELLLQARADANLANRDQATPLHIAAFMGRSKEASLLLAAGGDVSSLDGSGKTAGELLTMDFGTTNFIASSLGVPLDEATLLKGRRAIAELLGEDDYLGSESNAGASADLEALKGLLFQMPVFMHLWFLWFLCWLIVAFAVYAAVVSYLRIEKLPRWLVLSPVGLLWLVPLTTLTQSAMNPRTFGPDASVGLLPIPGVLIYYAVFFFFGAIYWDVDDRQGRLGAGWRISLPIAIFVVFPIAFDWVSGMWGIAPRLDNELSNRIVGSFLQAIFAWLMVLGSIGACRHLLSRPSNALRYLSDSSYWLYLAHLPVVILAQWLVRDLQIPPFIKFAGVVLVVSGLLLVTYEYGVRYTVVGRLLNGPRQRTATS